MSLPESADVSVGEKVLSSKDISVTQKEEEMDVDPCNQSESGKLASSLALSEEAGLLDSPSEEVKSVGSSILDSPPKKAVQDIGSPYDYPTWKKRKEVFLKAKSSDRLSFIDSYMHLDKLQRTSRCQDIDDILDRRPVPATPVYLQAVVAKFCHELPDTKLRQMWKRDSRIYHSHVIHPMLAHTASDQVFIDVRNAIIKDPHCVGIGEIGFDFSAHFISYKTQQIKLCKKFLQLFVNEELFSKVLVIHCRDRGALKLQKPP